MGQVTSITVLHYKKYVLVIPLKTDYSGRKVLQSAHTVIGQHIPHCGKIWQAFNLANPSSEHLRVLKLATTDTDRIRITQYRNVWQFLIWRFSANSPIHQIKNLAKFSRYTVHTFKLYPIKQKYSRYNVLGNCLYALVQQAERPC